MSETEDETQIREKAVIRNWYCNQSPQKQFEIAKPAFDKEHPTNADKKAAVEKYLGF